VLQRSLESATVRIPRVTKLREEREILRKAGEVFRRGDTLVNRFSVSPTSSAAMA
jgi:hypothetical protein